MSLFLSLLFVCLFVCFVRWLFVCFFAPVYRAFICWFQKHAIVYFCIICKLIKKKSVFFSLWKCLLYGKKVASYSEYLVEVDFLRIYTHINIYCKSISFFLFCGFQIDAVLELIICMSSSLEWHFLFVCVCVCVCKPKRTKKLLCVFLSLWVPLFLPPLCSFFLSFFSCYLCLLTYCIYILFLFFFFCHCNLYQQSRCLNNANPFFIQSRVQFSTLTTIVYCHRGIHGKLGDKAQTHSVWWWSQTRIQRAIIQQSHTPRCTIILQQWHALKDSRRWEGPSQLCSLHFSVHRNTLSSSSSFLFFFFLL